MSAAKKFLLRLFTFESEELRKSYNQFQSNNEKIMLSFCNLMLIPGFIVLLAFSIVFQLSYERIIIQTIITIVSIIAHFLGKKYLIIQKILLILVVGTSEAVYMLNNGFSDHNSDFTDRFLMGNGFGLVEMILVLSFKFMILRCAVFIMFIIIKLVVLLHLSDFTEYQNLAVFISIIMILAFLFLDNVLDRKIFRVVHESKDKLKKFQTLLSNDLPSSVVIINSTLSGILYSNDFFKKKFKNQEETICSREMDFHNVFSKFRLNRILNKELTEVPKEEGSLLFFLQKLDTDSSFSYEENHVMTLSVAFRDEDANDIHYEIKVRKIIWEENPSYAMVLNDVSDKERVIALKLADEQKDRVVATVSHELRTPINGILGLLEMVLARTSDAVSLEYIDYAKSCSKLLLYLVNSILDLNQLRHGCLQINKISFDLQRFLEELKSLYIFHSQQKGIDFRIITEPSVPKDIFTDKYRLIQILINLLGNAMKFTFQGSITLTISLDKVDSPKLIFCVEDTGIGIKEEDKPKMFKMYGKINQNDKSINSQGVGLGLTIANELVKLLNDQSNEEKIQFESEYEKGTKFWFRVDAFSEPSFLSIGSMLDQKDKDFFNFSERSIGSSNSVNRKILQYSVSSRLNSNIKSMKHSPAGDSSENNFIASIARLRKSSLNGHVLLVDDSPFNLMAAAFILEQLGFATQKAFNGKEGLKCLKESHQSGKRYSMILTDIQMPVLNGLEMSQCIAESVKKGELYDVPIVAVTAKKLSEQEINEYKEYGIAHAMEKPLVLENIKKVLDTLGLLQ